MGVSQPFLNSITQENVSDSLVSRHFHPTYLLVHASSKFIIIGKTLSHRNKLGGQGNRAADWYIHHGRNRSCHGRLFCGGLSAAPVGLQTCTTSNPTVGNEAFMTSNRFY